MLTTLDMQTFVVSTLVKLAIIIFFLKKIDVINCVINSLLGKNVRASALKIELPVPIRDQDRL